MGDWQCKGAREKGRAGQDSSCCLCAAESGSAGGGLGTTACLPVEERKGQAEGQTGRLAGMEESTQRGKKERGRGAVGRGGAAASAFLPLPL